MENKLKDEFIKQFGEHIKKIRIEKGLSGAELARRCYMDKPNIHRIENGGINPSIFHLYKICKGLEITLEELMKGFKFIEK